MLKKIILTLFLTGVLISESKSQKNRDLAINPLFAKTDSLITNMIDSLQIVGLNYAILIDNEVKHKKAFGLANKQLLVSMTLENSFPIASISKLFSSIAIHQLLNQLNRNVNETVEEFLTDRTDLPESWRKLTLKQLLSHTSGIPDQIDYQIYLAPDSEKFVIDALMDKPFSSLPGKESKYNATGFLLVRMILEKLANQEFESYMQKNFFEKFELSSAKYGGFKKVIPNRVTCYQNINNELEMFPLNYSSPMYAGAGLNLTISDLIKWFQSLQNEQILTKVQLEDIWTPVKLNDGSLGNFGLGWEAYILGDGFRMVGHGGAGISSFRHYWNENSNQNVTVIILTNGAYNWQIRPNQINAQIANIILSDK